MSFDTLSVPPVSGPRKVTGLAQILDGAGRGLTGQVVEVLKVLKVLEVLEVLEVPALRS